MVAFERFRAPLSEAEIERRSPDSLSPLEFRNLYQWGYPYVFEAFRFHMTVTGRVSDAEAPRIRGAIEEFFGAVLDERFRWMALRFSSSRSQAHHFM